MNTIVDRQGALARGLADIRTQFAVPNSFPPDVLAAAEAAATRNTTGRADWTDRPFTTLDPLASTDLDQAFAIERAGNDLLLHYAIADVAFFVGSSDPIDAEAWMRGTTIYLPDGKASLYPPRLSEGAASLLPNVERPAVVFTIRIDPEGHASLDGAVRAMIRSRAKFGYENVTPDQLPDGFAELSGRNRTCGGCAWSRAGRRARTRTDSEFGRAVSSRHSGCRTQPRSRTHRSRSRQISPSPTPCSRTARACSG